MSKAKEEKPVIEAERPTTDDLRKEIPQKQGEPIRISRAAAGLAAGETGAGATNRAQMSGVLQNAVGNTRAGQLWNVNQENRTPASLIQRRRQDRETPAEAVKRQDVVVIVGRPSKTTPDKESPAEKEQMETWRAAAHGFASQVFEGLTVDRAFAGLNRIKFPIGKLYIISHADVSGIGEIDPQGSSVSTTVEDLTARIKKASGSLGARRPESVEMLSCFGGGSPRTMGQIGGALGARRVRAPVQMTVISGRRININGQPLTVARMRGMQDRQLADFIQKTDAMLYYDFVSGVPHPDQPPSREQKLKALTAVLRERGVIPFISYNELPGQRNAVPYWKATVEKRKATDEDLDVGEFLSNRGVIEVDVQDRNQSP